MQIIFDVEKRTAILMKEKLEQAQQLLSDVYHYAFDIDNVALENQMSCADSCIIEALNTLIQSGK